MLWLLATLALAQGPVVVPHGGPLGPAGAGPRGGAVQRGDVVDGARVEGGVVARLDASGRIVATYGRDLPFAGRGAPVIAAPDAIARALAVAPGAAPRARIAWQPDGDAMRRVWTVEVLRPAGVLEVRVDAVTGGVLTVDDGAEPVDAPLARAYVHNPVVDPEPSVVALPLARDALSDERVELLQCRDLGEIVTYDLDSGVWYLHVCTDVPAAPPADGDYLYDPAPYPADPARDEDDFAAAHTYWNLHEGLAWFDALGWVPSPEFVDPRLIVTVNQRDTDLSTIEAASDPGAPLAPYDNAYSTGGYLDGDGEWVPPRLVFGQGAIVDYAYDADVVHHELGHYVVRSQSGPRYSPPGPYGPSTRASALNEGLADFFSSAIHGDPYLAEYAGGSSPIRDLDGDAACDTSLTGEPHNDGLVLGQALWRTRAALPEGDRATFDAAILDSLAVMGINADFPDAAAVIGDLVRERLGDAAFALLDAEVVARGMRDCPPVIDVAPGEDAFRRYVQVPGAFSAWEGEVPAVVQYRVEIPPGGARLTLTFAQIEPIELDLYGDLVPQPLEVHGRTGDRIAWHLQDVTVGEGDAQRTARDWIGDGARVATARETGTRDGDGYVIHDYSASWNVLAPGTYTFQLANTYPRVATAYEPKLAFGPVVEEELVVRSGCATAGAAPGWWAAAGLVALARRRRRASSPPSAAQPGPPPA